MKFRRREITQKKAYNIQYKAKVNNQEFLTLFNALETKHRLLYLRAQAVPRSKHFSSWLSKNQSAYVVSCTSRCLL
jgi:hypothetical protein